MDAACGGRATLARIPYNRSLTNHRAGLESPAASKESLCIFYCRTV